MTVPSFHGSVDATTVQSSLSALRHAELAVEQGFQHCAVVGVLVEQVGQSRLTWNRDNSIANHDRDVAGTVDRVAADRCDGQWVAAAGNEPPLLGVRAAGSTFEHHRTVVAPRHQPGLRERRHGLEVHTVPAGVPRGGGRAFTVGIRRHRSALGEPTAGIARGK